jgi:hypothetical protein
VFSLVLFATSPASQITSTAAQLNGEASGGAVSEAHFDFGTSANYGETVSASQSIGSSFFRRISGLAPKTTYHFRFVATIGGVTHYGSDETFYTHAPPVALDDTVLTSSSRLAPITINVLAKDTGVGKLSIIEVSPAAHGVTQIVANKVVYTPDIDYSTFAGSDTFTYTISDGLGDTSTGTVTVRNPFYGTKGSYQGLVTYAGGAFSPSDYGEMTLTVTGAGAFTGSLIMAGVKSAFVGKIGANGSVRLRVPRPNLPSLTLTMSLDPANGDQIHGTAADISNAKK